MVLVPPIVAPWRRPLRTADVSSRPSPRSIHPPGRRSPSLCRPAGLPGRVEQSSGGNGVGRRSDGQRLSLCSEPTACGRVFRCSLRHLLLLLLLLLLLVICSDRLSVRRAATGRTHRPQVTDYGRSYCHGHRCQRRHHHCRHADQQVRSPMR